mmetsp:Transcript_34138/g.105982  ORF Transcript_34138/g.105982 Transcript_34138/m.105982 type:complete len:246 (+) Transcript_34138:80-817(+)
MLVFHREMLRRRRGQPGPWPQPARHRRPCDGGGLPPPYRVPGDGAAVLADAPGAVPHPGSRPEDQKVGVRRGRAAVRPEPCAVLPDRSGMGRDAAARQGGRRRAVGKAPARRPLRRRPADGADALQGRCRSWPRDVVHDGGRVQAVRPAEVPPVRPPPRCGTARQGAVWEVALAGAPRPARPRAARLRGGRRAAERQPPVAGGTPRGAGGADLRRLPARRGFCRHGGRAPRDVRRQVLHRRVWEL